MKDQIYIFMRSYINRMGLSALKQEKSIGIHLEQLIFLLKPFKNL